MLKILQKLRSRCDTRHMKTQERFVTRPSTPAQPTTWGSIPTQEFNDSYTYIYIYIYIHIMIQ